MLDILPKPTDSSSPESVREYLCEDSDFQGEYPGLYEYLGRTKVSGQDRQPSRLVVYYEDEACTLMLCDPQTAKILFHTSRTVDEALAGLEQRLIEPPVRGWKNDKRYRR